MITGLHSIIYSTEAEKVREFFRDTLGYAYADAGQGWLIFAMPPAEVAVHPAGESQHELFLMCDDIGKTIEDLEAKGVSCEPPSEEGWGALSAITLPDGSKLGLYEPHHPLPPRA